jgi:hypothetical protein
MARTFRHRKQYTGFGNSAEPVSCNESVVIPTRFAQLGFIDLAELKIARPTQLTDRTPIQTI